MTEDPIQRHLEEAAQPTLERVRADRERVSARLKKPLAVLGERLFDDDFDINAMWRESRVKSKSASEWFSNELGMTPLSYLTDCRLRVGATLLLRTDLRLWEISIALGYSGAEVFARRFKNWCGQSPRDYRKNPEPQAWKAETPTGPDPKIQHRIGDLFQKIAAASDAGDYEAALADVSRAQDILRDQAILQLSAELARVAHKRGSRRTLAGDVDAAYDDLKLARDCYASSKGSGYGRSGGSVPPVSCDIDRVLLDSLCRGCREAFEVSPGRLAFHLRNVLRPVPADLDWFQSCCDDCYRVVWDAIERGRVGLLDDAWRALWLSRNVDPARGDLPPSRGLVIRLLVESELVAFHDPGERLALCQRATQAALRLDDPGLLARARICEGDCLRALSRHAEGRQTLHDAYLGSWDMALSADWIAAAYYRDIGQLESEAEDSDEAIPSLREAVARYSALDSHAAALCEYKLAAAYYGSGRWDDALVTLDAAVAKMDLRRGTCPKAGIVTARGLYLCALGRLDEAEKELDQFQSDQPVLVSGYEYALGRLRLEQGETGEALALLRKAEEGFLAVGMAASAALAASYRARHSRPPF